MRRTVKNASCATFAAWGRRLPFLASIVLIAVGLVVRSKVVESPVFAELREQRARSSRPIVEVFRERPRELLLCSAGFIANTTIGYVFLAYLLSYGTGVLELSPDLMLLVVVIGSIGWLVTIVIGALWSDRIGRRPVYLVGSVLLVVRSIPFFLLIDTAALPWMVVAVLLVVAVISLAAVYATGEGRGNPLDQCRQPSGHVVEGLPWPSLRVITCGPPGPTASWSHQR